jgi:hypothetical protein
MPKQRGRCLGAGHAQRSASPAGDVRKCPERS